MTVDALIRSALFTMDSERAHHAALGLLGASQSVPGGLSALRAMYTPRKQRSVSLMGLTFPNPVGLAAGYDKDAVAWRALGALGFGSVEVGTVTPEPQPGNPTPRVFRLTEDHCLVNRLGFPSAGADAVLPRLQAPHPGLVLGVNLGRNKSTPNEDAADDYVALVHRFAEVADYLTVNVSSPNTPGLRALQTGEALRTLLSQVRDARDATGKAVLPVLVKLSPDLEDADLDDALQAVVDTGIDGVIATNTTLSRDGASSPHASETGGLSGKLLTERAEDFVRRIRTRVGDDLPLIGVGGIMTADDAVRRVDAGADLVQVYTGLVYGGPSVIRQMVEALA